MEDSGKIFLFTAYLKYKQLINSKSLNNQASRISEVSVEVLVLDQAPLISRPEGSNLSVFGSAIFFCNLILISSCFHSCRTQLFAQ